MDSDQDQYENYDANLNIDTLDDQTQLNNVIEMNTIISAGKRPRSENNLECWQTVSKNNSKKKAKLSKDMSVESPIQVTVTSKEKMPKQFALAKLLKQNKIMDIDKIKYINPYKLLVTFSNKNSAENFLCCPVFSDLGWRIQKTWEVGLSYGIIRDIELGLSEKELVDYMNCEKEIVSAKRLNKKDGDEWVQSETFRITFKGSSLPSHVCLFELKIRVEPYTFPVTQCSKCWRFGHIAKMCPTSKIVCPKCSNYHNTCDTTTFKCPNCSGNHVAMSKQCPLYKKEKRIRELMSEHNYTYQKALSKYWESPSFHTPRVVRDPSPILECRSIQASERSKQDSVSSLQEVYMETIDTNIPSGSDKIKNKKKSTKKKKVPYKIANNVIAELETSDSEKAAEGSTGQSLRSENKDQTHWKSWSFSEVIQRIKDFIKEKKDSVVVKLKAIIKICIDWFTSLFTNLLPDLPVIVKMFLSDNG